MSSPLVSVVIPAYGQAGFLKQAIQSVLGQSYKNFEVIVVDDASPDNTSEIVRQFDDPRVRLEVHKENQGLPAARNTGIQSSRGELIAFLDADDMFHPDKLRFHVDFFREHPDIDVSYNPRFELNHSADTIRELWRPPLRVSLTDVVLGFPFSPSDMMVRKGRLVQVGLFDESFVCGGEDTDLPCRLALAGCKFASVDRALNYRRYHSGRRKKNLRCRLDDVVRALNATFGDPRCPPEVSTLQGMALKHHLMVLVYLALSYGETELGKEFLDELVRVDPSITTHRPSELLEFLLVESIADENLNHADVLKQVLSRLIPLGIDFTDQYEWAVGRGFLLLGTRNIIWGRVEKGENRFRKAVESKTRIDDAYLRDLSYQLMSFSLEFGDPSALKVIRDLVPWLEKFEYRSWFRLLQGSYLLDRAFWNYQAKEYSRVPRDVFRSGTCIPLNFVDRGVAAIFLRSLLSSVR